MRPAGLRYIEKYISIVKINTKSHYCWVCTQPPLLKKLDWSVLPMWLTCAAERGSGRTAVVVVSGAVVAGIQYHVRDVAKLPCPGQLG